MSPSAEWHFRLGPLDFSAGIRRFELRGVFPEQPRPLPDAAVAGELPRPARGTGGRTREAADDVLEWESEGGAGG